MKNEDNIYVTPQAVTLEMILENVLCQSELEGLGTNPGSWLE